MQARHAATAFLHLSLAIWACSSHPGVQTAGPARMTGKGPLFASTRTSSVLPEYRLGFGDVVEVKFFRNPQFNETLVVRPDGRVSLAKVGEMRVAGMTPAQLDSVITHTYAEFVIEPEVTVIVREFGGYQVYVLGEVTSPGGYAVQRNMTVLQALATAGGPKLSARLGSVMVLRRGQSDKVEALKVDVRQPLKAKQESEIYGNDVYLQPHDIVYVPKTFVASVSDFMRQVYSGFLPPLDLYLRAVLFYDR
ncbi:MAG: polysaccharide biosynthesis/export family protein [bacterium]